MKITTLPGTAYIAVLAFLTTWLQMYFGDTLWVPTAIAVIGGIIKMLELATEKEPVSPPPGALGAPMPEQEEKPAKTVRWLLG